jgi:hypothetical protein
MFTRFNTKTVMKETKLTCHCNNISWRNIKGCINKRKCHGFNFTGTNTDSIGRHSASESSISDAILC